MMDCWSLRAVVVGASLCLLLLAEPLLAQTQPATRRGRQRPQPRTWYVAPSGDDANPGTQDQPFRTIQKGADSAGPTDTVLIAGGTYSERITLKRSGRMFWGNIRIQAAPDAKVIIDAKDAGPGYAVIDTAGTEYVTLSGLTVQNPQRGVGIAVVGSWNITIEDCHTINTAASGIIVDKSGVVTVTRCEIEGACREGEESLSIKRSQHVTASFNHIHHTGHEGIDVKEGSQHVRVHDNHLHHVERQALYADAWDTHTADIRFYNNLVHDCGFGMVANSETGGLLANVWFYNNVVYNCQGPGMIIPDWGSDRTQHPLKDIYFLNNTIYNNGGGGRSGDWGGGMVFETTQAENVVVRNNILSRNGRGQLFTVAAKRPSSLIVENNLIDGDSEQIGNNFTGSPLFVDADKGDFRLQPTSPAIDAGSATDAPTTDITGAPRPQGRGIDLGAHELPR